MSENTGWVKLHRQITENELYFLEPFTKAQAWIDIFLHANHEDGSFQIRGNIVQIKRGQLGWSELTMAKRWTWSRDKVRRFLKYLETRQQIEQQKSPLTTLITVINYEQYQSEKQETRQQTIQQKDSRKTADDTQTRMIKNDKNDKEVILHSKQSSQVNELMGIFYKINPGLNFGNKTQRGAMEWMIEKWGLEKARNTVEFACTVQGQQYAPTITSPLQLKNKIGDLTTFFKKQNNNSELPKAVRI